MNFKSAQKLVALMRERGVTEGVKSALEIWTRNRLVSNSMAAEKYSFVNLPDHPGSLPNPQCGPLKIAWVLEPFARSSGGVTTIMRTIHQLEHWGHRQTVYILDPVGNLESVRKMVTESYFPIHAPVRAFAQGVDHCDALVATSWPTAYFVRSIPRTAAKFYFVQDLEFKFHPEGALSEFARETYRWGFHGITGGNWIADQLQGEFGMPCTPFGFSFDQQIYQEVGPKAFSDKRRRVLFYARPITERRGFEMGVLALSLVASRFPDVEVILLGYQGDTSGFPFRAVSSGLVPPQLLAQMYRSCEVALCLSHTNLSLLPLELMASGCAVVSNRGPNVEWLLNSSVAELTHLAPRELAGGIIRVMEDTELRSRLQNAGKAFALSTSWEREIKKVEQGFMTGLKIPRESKP